MKKKLNTPNTLSILRVILTPLFMLAAILTRDQHVLLRIIPALLFGLAAITDFLDGKIARSQNIVTDFGKFIDPLADKFMIFGACITFLVIDPHTASVFLWISALVMLRELAVTSLRLVASTSAGAVVAANMLGKIKTVMQIVFISTVFIEPALYAIPFVGNLLPAWWVENVPLTYLAGGLTVLFTVWAGANYVRVMWKYLDPEK